MGSDYASSVWWEQWGQWVVMFAMALAVIGGLLLITLDPAPY